MRFHHSALFGLGAASALLIAGGTAYAANGAALLLGRSNAATATTALNNSRGTPLALSAPAGAPPLRVNTAAKVANLNADHLDGLDATAFASTTGRTGIVFGSADDRDGFINTARCPSGTIATGGGGYATGTRSFGFTTYVANADRPICVDPPALVGVAKDLPWLVLTAVEPAT